MPERGLQPAGQNASGAAMNSLHTTLYMLFICPDHPSPFCVAHDWVCFILFVLAASCPGSHPGDLLW